MTTTTSGKWPFRYHENLDLDKTVNDVFNREFEMLHHVKDEKKRIKLAYQGVIHQTVIIFPPSHTLDNDMVVTAKKLQVAFWELYRKHEQNLDKDLFLRLLLLDAAFVCCRKSD